jgi:hypothetical protein
MGECTKHRAKIINSLNPTNCYCCHTNTISHFNHYSTRDNPIYSQNHLIFRDCERFNQCPTHFRVHFDHTSHHYYRSSNHCDHSNQYSNIKNPNKHSLYKTSNSCFGDPSHFTNIPPTNLVIANKHLSCCSR